MARALRRKIVVEPGGVVRVAWPELTAGREADVIVIIDDPPEDEEPGRGLASFIGAASGGFATPEEADAFLSAERDAWDS